MRQDDHNHRLNIAVIGSGIGGMSAAWLLSKRHAVTVFEQAARIGGHSNTVEAPGPRGAIPVDTGFIVYNADNYPNLAALFDHLDAPTKPSDMSFSVSLNDGAFEYGGDGLRPLFAQARNLASPRFWGMLRDIARFYRKAPTFIAADGAMISLGEFLTRGGYGRSFQNNHILPMAAAIWSTSVDEVRAYPAEAFLRFCVNHGLLRLVDRPLWRTVAGGSRTYVAKLTAAYSDRIRVNTPVRRVESTASGVTIHADGRLAESFDHVVLACHPDQALAILADPTPDEVRLLGAFRYRRNRAVLHSDGRLMPKRRAVWSSWNYMTHLAPDDRAALCVTYWMNRLQDIPSETPLFVTLNPGLAPREDSVIHEEIYEHPLFDIGAISAQRNLWRLQGRRRRWFCGAWFGSGFHEDGLQAGLAVAEALGGVRRPWRVANQSGRIFLDPAGTDAIDMRPAA
jgi:predicted NAD/FAD-binding protein